ncbi:MAG: multiheme c-type cytochrome [Coriobacteriia bacterium]
MSALAATTNPHAPASVEGASCSLCHTPHEAAVGENILKDAQGGTGELNPVTFCYGCHDGTFAVNVKTVVSNASFEGYSGHSVEPSSTTLDLTHVCADCHNPHSDSTTNFRLPKSSITVTLPTDVVVEREVTGANNTWCFACHDDEQSWYYSKCEEPYPSLAAPETAVSGYPVSGTFPGKSVYEDSSTNAHLGIPAGSMADRAIASREATRVAGDCLWCHSGHQGTSEYDGLVGKFGPSTAQTKDTVDGEYAEVCFICHKTNGLVSAPDIASAALGDATDSGHTIRTDGARYPKGAPLPCYECHNPHGSTRGNAANISDALGQNLDPRDPADPLNVGASEAKVRAFCFSCHVTYDVDPVTGRPWAWDSTAASGAGAYVAVSATAKAIGLPRNVAVNANDLRLPMANGHNKGDIERSCYECHGDVHRPMSGTSNGGVKCSVCHAALNGMVDDTNMYHHVLDDPNWDQAPGTYDPATGTYGSGAYPTSQTSLSCVSCHVDHSAYEPLPADDSRADGKSYSLRNSATVAYPTASSTDDTLCLSCHTEERARNTAGQKANTIQETSVWKIDATLWDTSPHNYDSPGPFNDGSTFSANCAKCHGNLQGTLSSGKFSVHFSAEQRLLNALGDTVAINLAINEEQMCFRCHSEVTDFVDNGGSLPGIPKPSQPTTTTREATDTTSWYSWDWYGTQAMSISNVAIYELMDPAVNNYGHKPAAYANLHLLSDTDETQDYIETNKHVECADCHNHHVVGTARHTWGTSNIVSAAIQGVSGQGFKLGTGVGFDILKVVNMPSDVQVDAQLVWQGRDDGYSEREYEICLKCHSSANDYLSTWGGTKTSVGLTPAVVTDRWTNVAADFNVGNQSRHPVFATLSGRYDINLDGVVASDGSETIPGYADTRTYGTSKVYPTQLDDTIWSPGDTMYCSDCHGNPNSPLPNDPNALNYTQGPHGSSVQYSLRGPNTSWPKNKAGTLWTIDMVTAAMATPGAELPFCSNCHPNIRGNQAHIKNNLHKSGPCIQCHIQIPHGGGMSRLIGDSNDSMPARYAYNNDKTTIKVGSFRKQANPLNYTTADCTVTSSGCVKSTSPHPTTDGTAANGFENW